MVTQTLVCQPVTEQTQTAILVSSNFDSHYSQTAVTKTAVNAKRVIFILVLQNPILYLTDMRKKNQIKRIILDQETK